MVTLLIVLCFASYMKGKMRVSFFSLRCYNEGIIKYKYMKKLLIPLIGILGIILILQVAYFFSFINNKKSSTQTAENANTVKSSTTTYANDEYKFSILYPAELHLNNQGSRTANRDFVSLTLTDMTDEDGSISVERMWPTEAYDADTFIFGQSDPWEENFPPRLETNRTKLYEGTLRIDARRKYTYWETDPNIALSDLRSTNTSELLTVFLRDKRAMYVKTVWNGDDAKNWEQWHNVIADSFTYQEADPLSIPLPYIKIIQGTDGVYTTPYGNLSATIGDPALVCSNGSDLHFNFFGLSGYQKGDLCYPYEKNGYVYEIATKQSASLISLFDQEFFSSGYGLLDNSKSTIAEFDDAQITDNAVRWSYTLGMDKNYLGIIKQANNYYAYTCDPWDTEGGEQRCEDVINSLTLR